jgi:acetyltransferase-like isoleucine patch superfamily enzyme
MLATDDGIHPGQSAQADTRFPKQPQRRSTRIFRPVAHDLGGGSPMPIVNMRLGRNVSIFHPELVNIYGSTIGDDTRIGPFVEIQSGSRIGARCKISSHSFICDGVTIEDEVFIGHGVMFTNGLFPHATNEDGSLQKDGDWELTPTRVEKGASIGSNATIVAGITIGRGALVAAGAVVTRSVPDYAVVAGNPARVLGDVRERESRRTAAKPQTSHHHPAA